MRSWMSLIMVKSVSYIWSYLPLNKEKLFDFVYTLASTNNNQSAQNLVTMNMRIRSQMSLIMCQVIQDQ